MKLNRTNKKITSLLFAILMITSVFVGFLMPVVADSVSSPISIDVIPDRATRNVTETQQFSATVLPADAN